MDKLAHLLLDDTNGFWMFYFIGAVAVIAVLIGMGVFSS